MTLPTGKPKGRPRKAVQVTENMVIDGAYSNVFMAVGTAKDRSAFTVPRPSAVLGQGELEALYVSDGFAKRIINLPAEEMLRAGYDIEGLDDASEVTAALDGIAANTELTSALRWARLYGGSLVVMLINDGNELDTPLNEENVKEIEQLRVYGRWQISIHKWYEDPADKRFGKPQEYQINPVKGNPYTVHESRCLRFEGDPVPDLQRESNEGWGGAVLQHCYSQLMRVNMSHYWANALLERAQQAVHGIPELSNILRAPNGQQMVLDRINMVDMARGVNNTVVIDAAETYEVKATSFSQVPDLLDRLGIALSAVTGIPESLLFGKPQSGLNSTGKSDLENWHAKIAQMQEVQLLPQLDRLVGLELKTLGYKTEDYEIKFKPLAVPSDKDKAESDYKTAQTYEIYVNMGAMDPSEVRMALPDEGFEIDDVDVPADGDPINNPPEELVPGVDPNTKEQTPREQAEVDLLKAQAEALRKPKADAQEVLGRIDNILGDLNV